MKRSVTVKLALLVFVCMTVAVNSIASEEIYGTLFVSVDRSAPRRARAGVGIRYQFGANHADTLTDVSGRYRLLVPDNTAGLLMVESRPSEFVSLPAHVASFQKPVNYDLLLSLTTRGGGSVATLSLWQPWQEKQYAQ